MRKKLESTTLFSGDNPSLVLVPGHVEQKVFNEATKHEWKGGVTFKQKALRYEYWKTRKSGKWVRTTPTKGKPFTVASWD